MSRNVYTVMSLTCESAYFSFTCHKCPTPVNAEEIKLHCMFVSSRLETGEKRKRAGEEIRSTGKRQTAFFFLFMHFATRSQRTKLLHKSKTYYYIQSFKSSPYYTFKCYVIKRFMISLQPLLQLFHLPMTGVIAGGLKSYTLYCVGKLIEKN